ncbi:ABC transporter permease [Streptomyces sp. NPDC086182]|uniref:ABC transporter permease n=1 Tax=Streptomyces sp. NPDC086182 TaxID=3155058 RepID=UPI003440F125
MLWDHVREVRESHGTTVFLSTHYLDEADALCDRVLIIDRGRIVAEDSPANLKQQLGYDVVTMELLSGAARAGTALAEHPAVRDVQVDGETLRLTVEHNDRVLTLVSVGFGLRAPLLGVVAGFVLVLALAISLASLSYLLALSLPTEYLFAPVINTVVLPLMLLSGILLPMTFAPDWLSVLSRLSPFRYIVDAMRDLFAGHYATGSVLGCAIVAVVLVMGSPALGTRKFVKANS